MTVDQVNEACSSGLRKKAQRADELERRVSEALLLLRTGYELVRKEDR